MLFRGEMAMTTEPPTRDAFIENDTRSTDNSRQLKFRSGHPGSSQVFPPARRVSTIMDGQKRPADNPVHSMPGIAATAVQTVVAQWTSIFLMISLIFGGCCANVFALEAIIKDRPDSGPLITFAQFILTALFMLPNFFSPSAGFRSFFLSRRSIPLRSWFIYTAFFVTVNLLNNWAFAYRISVPLHIILRSGGPVASIAVGYLYAGKRYSRGQILSVALLTFGVITSALADAQAKGQAVHIGGGGSSSIYSTFIGFAILALAMLLSAFQGIYADRLYETFGRSHWKEALFYSHTLSLPLFLPTFPNLLAQWRALNSSPSMLYQIRAMLSSSEHSAALLAIDETAGARDSCAVSMSAPVGAFLQLLVTCHKYEGFQPILGTIPVQVFYLLANALTQYWCIRGVHLLSAKSSSLTVTIVLNIRKLVSLLLSIHIFGNTLSHGVLVGAILVFVGGSLYGFEGARLRRAALKKD
ncbi:UAA transporter family-domain-containing protein [Aspergillus falconensis]